MQLHHLCSVHACLSRTYPAHHELEIVFILIISVIIIIIMLALDSTAVSFCMFALCVIPIRVKKIADTVIWKSAVTKREDEIPTAMQK